MKKILFVTPYNPFVSPLGAASKSVRYRIEHLSEVAEVHLFTFASNKDQVIPNHFAEKTHLVAHPVLHSGGRSRLIRFSKTILGKVDALANIEILSEALGKEVQRVTSNTRFDLIHIDDIIIAPVMKYCPENVKKILFFHNLMTLQYRNIFRSRKQLFKKIISYIEYLHIRKYEKRLLLKMEYAVVLTKREQETAKILSPKSKFYQIPLEINLDQYAPVPESFESNRITFTGTMSYEPNHEGALSFVKDIFPLIKKDYPKAQFCVVGMNPPQDLLALDDGTVIVTGEVPNIQHYINQAQVVVVPLLSGGGMRFKILEAFALGKAVVSTSVGAEGIEYQDHQNIIIADDPAHFARQVCGLLADPCRREELGSNARRLVETTYASGVVQRQWFRLYSDILEQPLADKLS